MKTRLRHRFITFIIITAFLCQNIAFAKGPGMLMPKSKVMQIVRELPPDLRNEWVLFNHDPGRLAMPEMDRLRIFLQENWDSIPEVSRHIFLESLLEGILQDAGCKKPADGRFEYIRAGDRKMIEIEKDIDGLPIQVRVFDKEGDILASFDRFGNMHEEYQYDIGKQGKYLKRVAITHLVDGTKIVLVCQGDSPAMGRFEIYLDEESSPVGFAEVVKVKNEEYPYLALCNIGFYSYYFLGKRLGTTIINWLVSYAKEIFGPDSINYRCLVIVNPFIVQLHRGLLKNMEVDYHERGWEPYNAERMLQKFGPIFIWCNNNRVGYIDKSGKFFSTGTISSDWDVTYMDGRIVVKDKDGKLVEDISSEFSDGLVKNIRGIANPIVLVTDTEKGILQQYQDGILFQNIYMQKANPAPNVREHGITGRGLKEGEEFAPGEKDLHSISITILPLSLLGLLGVIFILTWQNNPHLVYIREILEYLRIRIGDFWKTIRHRKGGTYCEVAKDIPTIAEEGERIEGGREKGITLSTDSKPYKTLAALLKRSKKLFSRIESGENIPQDDLGAFFNDVSAFLDDYNHLNIQEHPLCKELLENKSALETKLRKKEEPPESQLKPAEPPPECAKKIWSELIPGPERDMGMFLEDKYPPEVVEDMVKEGMHYIEQGVLKGGAGAEQLVRYMAILKDNKFRGQRQKPVRLIYYEGIDYIVKDEYGNILGWIPNLVVLKRGHRQGDGLVYEHIKKGHLHEFMEMGMDEEEMLDWLVKTIREGHKESFLIEKGRKGLLGTMEFSLHREEKGQVYKAIVSSNGVIITFFVEYFQDEGGLSKILNITTEQALRLMKYLTGRVPVSIDGMLPNPADIEDLVIGFKRDRTGVHKIRRRIYFYPGTKKRDPFIGIWNHEKCEMILMDLNRNVFDVVKTDKLKGFHRVEITNIINKLDSDYLKRNEKGEREISYRGGRIKLPTILLWLFFAQSLISNIPSSIKTIFIWTLLITILIVFCIFPVSDCGIINFGKDIYLSISMAAAFGGMIDRGDGYPTLQDVLQKGVRYLKEQIGEKATLSDKIIWTGISSGGLEPGPGWEDLTERETNVLISVGSRIFNPINWVWVDIGYNDLPFMSIRDAVNNMLLKNDREMIMRHLERKLNRIVNLDEEVEYIWIDRFQEGAEGGVLKVTVHLKNGAEVKFGIISAKNTGIGNRVVENDSRNLRWVRSLYMGYNQKHVAKLPIEMPEVYEDGFGDCVHNDTKYSINMFTVEWLDDVYEMHPLIFKGAELIFAPMDRGIPLEGWSLETSREIRERTIIMATTIFELTGGKIPRIVYSGGDIVANVDREGNVKSIFLITIPYFSNDEDSSIGQLSKSDFMMQNIMLWRRMYEIGYGIQEEYILFLLHMFESRAYIFGVDDGGNLTSNSYVFNLFPEPEIVFSGLVKALIRMYGKEEGVKRAFEVFKRFSEKRTQYKRNIEEYLERFKREYGVKDYEEEQGVEGQLRKHLNDIKPGSYIVASLRRLTTQYPIPEGRIVAILEELGFSPIKGDEDKWKRISWGSQSPPEGEVRELYPEGLIKKIEEMKLPVMAYLQLFEAIGRHDVIRVWNEKNSYFSSTLRIINDIGYAPATGQLIALEIVQKLKQQDVIKDYIGASFQKRPYSLANAIKTIDLLGLDKKTGNLIFVDVVRELMQEGVLPENISSIWKNDPHYFTLFVSGIYRMGRNPYTGKLLAVELFKEIGIEYITKVCQEEPSSAFGILKNMGINQDTRQLNAIDFIQKLKEEVEPEKHIGPAWYICPADFAKSIEIMYGMGVNSETKEFIAVEVIRQLKKEIEPSLKDSVALSMNTSPVNFADAIKMIWNMGINPETHELNAIETIKKLKEEKEFADCICSIWLKNPANFVIAIEIIYKAGIDPATGKLKIYGLFQAVGLQKIGLFWHDNLNLFMNIVKAIKNIGLDELIDLFKRIGENIIKNVFRTNMTEFCLTLGMIEKPGLDEDALGIKWIDCLSKLDILLQREDILAIMARLPEEIKPIFKTEAFMMIYRGYGTDEIVSVLADKYEKILKHIAVYNKYLSTVGIEVEVLPKFERNFPEIEARFICLLLGIKLGEDISVPFEYSPLPVRYYALLKPYFWFLSETGAIPDDDVCSLHVSVPYLTEEDRRGMYSAIDDITLISTLLYSPDERFGHSEEIKEMVKLPANVIKTSGDEDEPAGRAEARTLAFKKSGSDHLAAIRFINLIGSCFNKYLKDPDSRDEVENRLSAVWEDFINKYRDIIALYREQLYPLPPDPESLKDYFDKLIRFRNENQAVISSLRNLVSSKLDEIESILEHTMSSYLASPNVKLDREGFRKIYAILVENIQVIYPDWEPVDADVLYDILNKGKLPSDWPSLVSAMRRDGIIDEDDFRVITEIGRIVEKGTDLGIEVKELLTKSICINYLIQKADLEMGFKVRLRERLNLIGYMSKIDIIIMFLRGLKRRLKREGGVFNNRSEYVFVRELEQILGMRGEIFAELGVEDTNLRVSDIMGNKDNGLFRRWADIFKLNQMQWKMLGGVEDKQPKGVIVQDIRNLGRGVQNWLEGIRRYNVDISGVQMAYLIDGISEEERKVLLAKKPPNVILLEEIKGENIVYLANKDRLERYKGRGIKLVERGNAGPVIELSLCLYLLDSDDIGPFNEKLARLGFEGVAIIENGYIKLPEIKDAKEMWEELEDGVSYLDVWA